MEIDRDTLKRFTEMIFTDGIEWEKRPEKRLYETPEEYIDNIVNLIWSYKKGGEN